MEVQGEVEWCVVVYSEDVSHHSAVDFFYNCFKTIVNQDNK